jgi:hypothetical protein
MQRKVPAAGWKQKSEIAFLACSQDYYVYQVE